MKKWVLFSVVKTFDLRCKKGITFLWEILLQFVTGELKIAMSALATCIFALGGAIVGIMTGGIKGQTTETGLVRGAGVGAVVGAITALQLLESMVDGEPFSKVALFYSLFNGKVFVEWASPAILKAYQWQVSSMEISSTEILDIFEATVTSGLSQDYIKKLPNYKFLSSEFTRTCDDIICAICLQSLKNGDLARTLQSCTHSFHLHCIDEWLTRQGSCPICRKDV